MKNLILAMGVALVATSAAAGGDLKVFGAERYHNVKCVKKGFPNTDYFKINSKGEAFLTKRVKKQASFKEFFKTGKSEFWKNPEFGWASENGNCGIDNPFKDKEITDGNLITDTGSQGRFVRYNLNEKRQEEQTPSRDGFVTSKWVPSDKWEPDNK